MYNVLYTYRTLILKTLTFTHPSPYLFPNNKVKSWSLADSKRFFTKWNGLHRAGLNPMWGPSVRPSITDLLTFTRLRALLRVLFAVSRALFPAVCGCRVVALPRARHHSTATRLGALGPAAPGAPATFDWDERPRQTWLRARDLLVTFPPVRFG